MRRSRLRDEVFKRQIARPLPVDLNARRCEKLQFNLVRDVRRGVHHIVKPQDQSIICQHLGVCGVKLSGGSGCLARVNFRPCQVDTARVCLAARCAACLSDRT